MTAGRKNISETKPTRGMVKTSVINLEEDSKSSSKINETLELRI